MYSHILLVIAVSLWDSASEIVASETPEILASVAPVCRSLCGEAGASSGCLFLIVFMR